MFGSAVLEVAIGLVLVYLLISIVLTSVSEAIEAMLKTRASDLEHALSQIFQGNSALLKEFYEHPLVAGLYRGDYQARSDVTAARGRSEGRGNLPSYIPRDTFSAVVADLAANPDMKKAIAALEARAGADVAAKRRALEAWYDGAMDRASGWFKRRTQGRLFAIGLLVALVGNVNSVTIGQYLAINQEARQAVVELAEQARTTMPQPAPAGDQAGDNATENGAATGDDEAAGAAANNAAAAEEPDANAAAAEDTEAANATAAEADATGNETGDDSADSNTAQPGNDAAAAGGDQGARARATLAQLRSIGLPIGWSDPVAQLTVAGFPPSSDSPWFYLRWLLAALTLMAGYLATAFAVMLGAPFWFDLLNKLMVVRSTVKPREKSPDEPPVDGPAPPAR
jgi:hypothetical protein